MLGLMWSHVGLCEVSLDLSFPRLRSGDDDKLPPGSSQMSHGKPMSQAWVTMRAGEGVASSHLGGPRVDLGVKGGLWGPRPPGSIPTCATYRESTEPLTVSASPSEKWTSERRGAEESILRGSGTGWSGGRLGVRALAGPWLCLGPVCWTRASASLSLVSSSVER